jgi:2'-hydroxyisoflavone reductase
LNLLVLGGTRFLGRTVVEFAIDRGYEVTIFSRGYHGRQMFPQVRRLRGDRTADISALRGAEFDAVLDTSAYLPRTVRSVAEELGPRVRHYTFVSTVAVYAGITSGRWAEELDVREASEEEISGADGIEVGEIAGKSYGPLYGPLKASCERIVKESFETALIVRPGLVVGPHDFGGDRFAYWPRRVREGGNILAPGHPETPLQVIDVRDLASWVLDMIEGSRSGTYNAVGPGEQLTMAGLLDKCRAVSRSNADFTWVDDEFLKQAGLMAMDLPLWAPKAANEMLNTTANDRATAAGLSFRPVIETIADVLSWEQDNPQPISFPRQRELEILMAWNRRSELE